MISCVLALLAPHPVQSQDQTLPGQVTEAFGKVVAVASQAVEEIPGLAYRPGACFMGGYLKTGGKISYTMNIKDAVEHAALTGAYGNDFEISVTVTDSKGKSVVTDSENTLSVFKPTAPGTYVITATNKGAASFVALAILQESGGKPATAAAINTAAAKLAAGFTGGFSDGYSIPTNRMSVVGAVLDKGASFPRTESFNGAKSMVIAAGDGPSRNFSMSLTNQANNQVLQATEDSNFAFCTFESPMPKATVTLKNTASRGIVLMSGRME